MPSRSIHVVEKSKIFFYLMAEWYSIVCLYHIFIHLSIDGDWVCFHIWATVNNDVMNLSVHTSLQYPVFISFGCLPRSDIAGSYSSSMFNFLRNFHTIFHSGCTTVHSHQESTSIRFTSHPCQHLPLLCLKIVILTGVRRCLNVVVSTFP